VASDAFNLANVIFRQEDGNLITNEGLARDAIRIKVTLYDAHDSSVST
jgi:hypothetical protein